jgi:Dolichyl-phosphate-mannose-protein mannosyltransferase
VGAVSASTWVLGTIVLAGLALRLVNIDHGLPFVYQPDEANHFTNRAVGMFGSDLDPGYFRNPSAFTYAIHLLLRAQYGALGLVDGPRNVVRDCRSDPSAIYLTGRVLATVLCMLSVIAVYAVGRRLWSAAEGLTAAAVLAFAFLPVAYSRFALTDVGALLPVTIAVYGAVRAQETGRLAYFALAGAAVGLAVGFKYTAGLLVAPLVAASLLTTARRRTALLGLATAAAVGLIAFLLTNPFFVLRLGDAIDQLSIQTATAHRPKLGQRGEYGAVFYLRSLTWALGWGATLAAGAGALWELHRSKSRAIVLIVFPLLLFAFLSTAERFFARWLMPAFPVLALLAGVALTRVASHVASRPRLQRAALTALLAAVLAQPLAADVRTAVLLGRTDTREMTWAFLVRTQPYRTRVVVEPAIPMRVIRTWLTPGFGAPPRSEHPAPAAARFVRSRRPALIDLYRASGHCVIVSFGSVRRRLESHPLPKAQAYYRRLESESSVIFETDPYRGGGRPRFDLDQTLWLYYPPSFERPGPEAIVYRLDHCRAAHGAPQTAVVARAARTPQSPDRFARIARPVRGHAASTLCRGGT